MPEPLLSLSDVKGGYGDLRILNGVDLFVGHGERVLVFGPNGSGKSTLLKTICGLAEAQCGSIRLGGEEIVGETPPRIVAKGISYVPQIKNVFPDLTVAENLEIGAVLARKESDRRMADVFELFPLLAERRRQIAGLLSGGERQLVAMGRALMLEPKILLLDEPSGGLAPAMIEEALQHLLHINRERGTALLLVEQNVTKAMGVSERAYLLETGRVRLEGSVQEMRASPQVARIYLGHVTEAEVETEIVPSESSRAV